MPVLQSPKRPLIARKLSSAGSPGRPPPNLGDAPLDSSSRPSTSQYEGDVSPTDTRRARLSSPPAPSQAYTRHGGRSEPRRSGTLNEALTGLDNLMQEAVQLAQEAADQGRPEEFSQVLEEATHTLRRASAVSNRHRANLMQPLPASESESDYGSSDSSEDDTLVNPETTRSSATMLSTKALPIHVSVHPNKEGQKNSEHIDIVDDLHSLSGTPPHFYHPLSHESIVKDFAYGQARREPSQDAVSVATDGLPRRTSRLPAHHRNTPIEPLAAQQSTRQILDGVIHTVPPRGSSLPRRPSVQAETIPNPWRPRHANTELDVDYDTPRRRRTSRHLDVNENHFEDPRRQKRHDRNLDPETKGLSLKHRKHFSLRSHQGFSFGHHVRRQPIARKWGTFRKRITATIACISTGFIGYVIGVYAGEVPRIQYQVIDPKHYIIQGNIYLFLGLALSTFFFWPLPLLHGRKPYTLAALALALPLQFPQAVLVSAVRQPSDASFRNGLLVSRFFSGMALGFCNINFITTLFDLFGASLQSSNPHQELVIIDDVRRQGGGMGIWLGIWSWCFIGSIALGFLSGAGIIAHLNPEWGFYVTVIVGAGVLILNILAPETRRSPYRRSFTEFVDDDEKVRRRIARGEVKLHLESDGPKWWGQEVWAGIRLNVRMMFQPGFFVLASYLGWTYAEIVLVIVVSLAMLTWNTFEADIEFSC